MVVRKKIEIDLHSKIKLYRNKSEYMSNMDQQLA